MEKKNRELDGNRGSLVQLRGIEGSCTLNPNIPKVGKPEDFPGIKPQLLAALSLKMLKLWPKTHFAASNLKPKT